MGRTEQTKKSNNAPQKRNISLPSQKALEEMKNVKAKGGKGPITEESEESESRTRQLAKLENFANQEEQAKSRMANFLDDIRNRNFRLKDVKGEANDNQSTVDVTAAVRANPGAFGSHAAFTKLFKANVQIGGLHFSGTSEMLDTHFYYWPDFKTVTKLDISFCPNISDFGIRLIKEAFPKLVHINACGCRLVTETALRVLSNDTLAADFSMASVRYVPNNVQFAKLNVNGCPLIIGNKSKQTSSTVPAENQLGSFSFAKVVVVKPRSFANVGLVAKQWLPPDGNVLGSADFVATYRSGIYRIFECSFEAPIQLFVSNNCLIVLPFECDAPDLAAEYQNVEERFNFISSRVTNVRALAVPYSTKQGVVSALSESAADLLRKEQLKSVQINSASPSEKEKRAPEENPRLARTKYYVNNHLEFLFNNINVSDWISVYRPHADLPRPVLELFSVLDKANFFSQKFCKRVKDLGEIVPQGSNSSSFAQLLFETGNCWLEAMPGYDSPLPGPDNFMMSTESVMMLISDLLEKSDKTAISENFRFIPGNIQLGRLGFAKFTEAGMDEARARRIYSAFEENGVAIIDPLREYALPFSFLPVKPHIPIEHFMGDSHHYQLTYNLTCAPTLVLNRITSALCKICPPALLWKSGAIFQECAVFVVHLETVESSKTIYLKIMKVQPSALQESAHQEAFDSFCSILHSICASVLQSFATEDLFASRKAPNGNSNLILRVPSLSSHIVCKFDSNTEGIRTFTRVFDLTKPRCMFCLLTSETLNVMERCYTASQPNIYRMKSEISRNGKPHLIAKLPLDLCHLDCFFELLSYGGIASLAIGINDWTASRNGSYLKITILEKAQFEVCIVDIALPNGKGLVVNQTVRDKSVLPLHDGGLRIDAHLCAVENKPGVEFLISCGSTTATKFLSVNPVDSLSYLSVLVTANDSGKINIPCFSYAYHGKLLQSINGQVKRVADKEIPVLTIEKMFELQEGMILEAVSLKQGTGFILPAKLAEINWMKKTVLITMHDKSEMFKSSQILKEERSFDDVGLFPIGFAKYLSCNELLFNRFKAMLKTNMNIIVAYNFEAMSGMSKMNLSDFEHSSLSKEPTKGLDDLFSDATEEAIPQMKFATISDMPQFPFALFEKSHLLGFPVDFMSQLEVKNPCPIGLSANISTRIDKLDVHSNSMRAKFRSRIFAIPMNGNLTWQNVMWPSHVLVRHKNGTVGYPVCPGLMIHFVNENLFGKAVTTPKMRGSDVFHCLHTMASQAHFIPDKSDRLFPDLQLPNPYRYDDGKNETNRQTAIEFEFVCSLIPYLLDYFLCYYNDKITIDTSEPFKSYETYIEEDNSAQLILSSSLSKEYDIYRLNELCPYAMCARHAYSLSNFDNRIRNLNYEQLHESLSLESNYDSLTTMKVFVPDESVGEFLGHHPNLTDLHLGRCKLSTLPSPIFSLRFLTDLIIRENNLTDLSSEFQSLATSLQSLDISENSFANNELPPVIFELKNLRSLRADFLSVSKLSEDIGNLVKLNLLSLRSNCLSKLPENIVKLSALRFLDLSGLPLFPLNLQYKEEAESFLVKNHFPAMAESELHRLWPAQNPITRDHVEKLNAQFINIFPRFKDSAVLFKLLGQLVDLNELILTNQGIAEVPEDIGKLEQLRRVDFSGCLHLKTISSQISKAPLEILHLSNCPVLSTPPAEIRNRGFLATTAYFRRLALGSVVIRRTKLMFVGLGGAGKTSLAGALVSAKAKESHAKTMFAIGVPSTKETPDVTDGIHIADWLISPGKGEENVHFKLWDFAGQVVYYNTHQFFLSSRAVYLIMWNIRLGHEHAGIEFWLSSIASHAPNANVIIVGTHADQVPEERSFLPEMAYRERFSSICGFHYVSSRTGKGIEELRSHILEVAVKQKHMGEAIPRAWMTFEEKLTTRPLDGPSVVMFSDVVKTADASGIYERDELEQALQFLSDLGSIQYFKTDFLKDRVIINPQWIVDVMAALVSIKDSPIKDGKMLHSDLKVLWNKFPTELHPWLLKLTEAFDLTFPIKGEEAASLIPCMLPENAPEKLEWPDFDEHPDWKQTQLILQFKYLPTGLFNRAQVRLCQLSEGRMWRRGSLLKKNRHFALISQPDATSVHVKVQGPQPENISFLILEVFDSLIHESFHGLQPEYLFSCPECVTLRASQPSMFERSRIRRATELHIPTLQCFHYFHQIPTRELRQLLPAENAGDFDYQFSRTIQLLSGLTQSMENDVLVIGTSKDVENTANFVNCDIILRDLQRSLNSLKVTCLTPDSLPFDQVSLMVRTARLIICCLSPNFMSNENCQAVLLTARETLRKPVLIVLVRDLDIKKFNSLSFILSDEVYIKAINKSRYKAEDVVENSKRRLGNDNDRRIASAKLAKHPKVFISYCWQNSKDAIERGTKPREGSVGVCDPRALKKYLVESGGFECWIDVEQVGRNGLFEDIAVGLRNAKVVIVCVSDEYVDSKNCLREFRFAQSVCALPLILCVVGTGMAWKQSEVSLIVPPSAPLFNFQIESPGNYEKLVVAVKAILESETSKPAIRPPTALAAAGRKKTLENIKAPDNNSQDATATIYQEIRELEQRRFLRQLISYSNTALAKPYPRLVILDIDSAKTPPPVFNETDTLEVLVPKLTWSVRFLCEHEEGWHPTDSALSLSADNVQVLLGSAAYLGRVFALIKHGSRLPELLVPKQETMIPACNLIVQLIEKFVKFEDSFEIAYVHLLQTATKLDQHGSCGNLQLCQLAIGKELWLCNEHSHSDIYRMKGAAGGHDESTINDLGSNAEKMPDNSNSFIGKNFIEPAYPKQNLPAKTSRACNLQ